MIKNVLKLTLGLAVVASVLASAVYGVYQVAKPEPETVYSCVIFPNAIILKDISDAENNIVVFFTNVAAFSEIDNVATAKLSSGDEVKVRIATRCKVFRPQAPRVI